MAGSRAGGLKAAATNKAKRGDDYYKNIGRKGGKAQVPKGFAVMPKELASKYGRIGGKTPKKQVDTEENPS